MTDLLVRGKYVLIDAEASDSSILEDASVLVANGRISEIGTFAQMKEKYGTVEIVGNGKQLLMPGLIDSHSHGWGLTAIQRGVNSDFLENALIDWAAMVDLDPELNSMMSAVRHIRSGCTTLHHNHWGERPDLLEIAQKNIRGYKQVGIRLAYSLGIRNKNILALDDDEFYKTLPLDLQEFCRPMVFFDREAAVEEFFNAFEEIYRTYKTGDTQVFFGPSWAQGSTDEFLIRVKARADELGKLPIHIHTLQTPIQKAYGLRKYGKSLLAHLDDIGLVDSNLVLGHAVYVNETDINLLAEKRASTTHHPSCNLVVRNGISPVYYLLKAGVNVALGIDDKGINDDEDIMMELRMIYYLHRVPGFDLAKTPALTSWDVLKIGTINGARVCGFDGQLGTLKPGMMADMILVDLGEIMEEPWISPEVKIVDALVQRGKGNHVNTAIIAGDIVMKDRVFTKIDIDDLYKEVRKQAAKGPSPEQIQYAHDLQKLKPFYHQWYEGWVKSDIKPFYILNSRN